MYDSKCPFSWERPSHVTRWEACPKSFHSSAHLASKVLVTPTVNQAIDNIDVVILGIRVSMFFKHTRVISVIYIKSCSTIYPSWFAACLMLSGYAPQLSSLYLRVWAVDHISLFYAHAGSFAGFVLQTMLFICIYGVWFAFWYQHRTNYLHPPQRLKHLTNCMTYIFSPVWNTHDFLIISPYHHLARVVTPWKHSAATSRHFSQRRRWPGCRPWQLMPLWIRGFSTGSHENHQTAG